MATTSMPTAAAQKRAINELEAKARMEPGDVWCIIDGKWYGKWRSWIAGELFGGAPGAIDNSSLLDSDKVGLRPGLVESTDFHVIPETVWNKFEAWYGGGPKLSRTVIVQGEETFVEVAPPIFRVQTASRPTAVMPVSLSKQAPVRELKRRAVEALRLTPSEADSLVMVSVFDGPEMRVLDQPDVSIEDARLVTGQNIRLQAPTKATASPTSPPKSSPAASVVVGTRNAGAQLGVCGLSNLGNTCFMNSALQCLSATPALREFFLTGRFTAEINRNNPIGAKGQLAEQFGELLQNMWNGKASFAPRDLKWTIGKFAPRFSGYQQQDAQELLAFLLDGLHEDLNRVLMKPYIPTPAEEGAARPDAQVAAEAWERHLKRNQSIIVDLFQAQLKSTVRCPDCQLVSVTFDPFMYLGLPLPSTRQQSFDIIACLDERGCCKYGVSVDVRATVMSLKSELSNLLSPQIPPSRIWITDISKNCITMKWDDNRAASDLPKKVFAYVIPQAAKPLRQIQVIQRVQAETVPGQPISMKTYGMPCLVHVTIGTTTAADAYAALLARFAPILRNASAFAPGGPFPFALAIVDQRGIGCGACKAATCGGCPLPPTATPLNPDKIPAIALDWLPIANRNLDEENRTRVDPSAKRAGNGAENSRTLSLQQCLTNFCNSEQLGPQDLWYCPRCKTHRQAFKRMELFTAPEYLVIHLKRFAFSQSMRNKIDTVVEFPVDGLNLAPFLQSAPRGPEIYDLYAISNHMGGLGGGHYTAHVKSPNGQWFLMNDSTYQPVRDMRELQTANAYLLFYARRHIQAPPPEASANGAAAAAEESVAAAGDAKRRRADE